MPGVEDDGVGRRAEDPVQRQGQLDDAQIRPEMTAALGHLLDQELPDLRGQFGQLRRRQRLTSSGEVIRPSRGERRSDTCPPLQVTGRCADRSDAASSAPTPDGTAATARSRSLTLPPDWPRWGHHLRTRGSHPGWSLASPSMSDPADPTVDVAIPRRAGRHAVVIAHRGASAHHPENTAPAFVAGWDAGAQWVEADTQPTADGVPVVLHDADLDRTTSGRGPVRDQDVAAVTAVDAGAWFLGGHHRSRRPDDRSASPVGVARTPDR